MKAAVIKTSRTVVMYSIGSFYIGFVREDNQNSKEKQVYPPLLVHLLHGEADALAGVVYIEHAHGDMLMH